jgi:hypothetical protein
MVIVLRSFLNYYKKVFHDDELCGRSRVLEWSLRRWLCMKFLHRRRGRRCCRGRRGGRSRSRTTTAAAAAAADCTTAAAIDSSQCGSDCHANSSRHGRRSPAPSRFEQQQAHDATGRGARQDLVHAVFQMIFNAIGKFPMTTAATTTTTTSRYVWTSVRHGVDSNTSNKHGSRCPRVYLWRSNPVRHNK